MLNRALLSPRNPTGTPGLCTEHRQGEEWAGHCLAAGTCLHHSSVEDSSTSSPSHGWSPKSCSPHRESAVACQRLLPSQWRAEDRLLAPTWKGKRWQQMKNSILGRTSHSEGLQQPLEGKGASREHGPHCSRATLPRTATSPPQPVGTVHTVVHSASPSQNRTDVTGMASCWDQRPREGWGILETSRQGLSSTHASTSGKSCSLLGKISDSSTRTKGRPRALRRDSRCCREAERQVGAQMSPASPSQVLPTAPFCLSDSL